MRLKIWYLRTTVGKTTYQAEPIEEKMTDDELRNITQEIALMARDLFGVDFLSAEIDEAMTINLIFTRDISGENANRTFKDFLGWVALFKHTPKSTCTEESETELHKQNDESGKPVFHSVRHT